MLSIGKQIKGVTLFGITMGLFEAAVVIYLRELFYPHGFSFPLHEISLDIALVEAFRELASLLMIISVSYLVGKRFTTCFAYFLFIFALWDIFYYIFLKVFIGWPESLLTWDILFLLPTNWVGPVISPVIVSLTMLVFASSIIYYSQKVDHIVLTTKEWLIFIAGAFIIFISFIWDYCAYVYNNASLNEMFEQFGGDQLSDLALNYIPNSFPWIIFIIGEIILIYGITRFRKRNKKLIKD